jgi:hypothetical protein
MLRVEWSQAAGSHTAFRVERRNGMQWETAGTPGAAMPFLEVGGLQPATTYTFRIFATNIAGDSPPSAEVSGETLPNPPASPTPLQAVADSHSQVTLNWSDVSGETGYQVWRKLGIAPAFTQIGTRGAGETSWTDSGLTELTLCTYRVMAVNAGGSSGPAEAALTTPPQPPSGVTGHLMVRQIRVDWNDHSSGESGFQLERKDGSGKFQVLDTAPPNATSYISGGLTPGIAYTYRITALGPGGSLSLPAESSPITVPPNVAGARLSVKPMTVNLGTVRIGRTKTKQVTLKNLSSAPITVFVGDATSPFQVTSGQGLFTLGPKGVRKFTVALSGKAAGAKTGSVPISSTAGGTPTLVVGLRAVVR